MPFQSRTRRQFSNSLGCPRCIGGQVDRAEGADFSKSHDSAIGLNLNDRGVKDIDAFAFGPAVIPFGKWKVDLKKFEPGDFHLAVLGRRDVCKNVAAFDSFCGEVPRDSPSNAVSGAAGSLFV